MLLLNRDATLADPNIPRRAPPDLLQFLSGADLVIADGQYTDKEYPNKINWGHARANTLVDVCLEAGVKNLAVTHHDPMHSDDMVDRKIQECRERVTRFNGTLTVFGAREGITLKYA